MPGYAPYDLLYDLLQDLRYALRMVKQTPGFTAVTVLILGLGIGANTATFSIVHGALLQRLPYPHPDELMALETGNPSASRVPLVSPADFRDWRQQSTLFAQIAGFTGTPVTLQQGEHPETVPATRGTDNFFDTLGVKPLIGRGFTPDEGLIRGPQAIVVSQWLWETRFDGDPDVIGKQVQTVVGVLPASFRFPSDADAWVPMYRDSAEMDYRAARYWRVIGRLRSGQSIEAARAEMQAIAGRLSAAYKDDAEWSVSVTRFSEWRVRDFRSAVLMLMGGFVCAAHRLCERRGNDAGPFGGTAS
jgi:putative ABC transport system permease protein